MDMCIHRRHLTIVQMCLGSKRTPILTPHMPLQFQIGRFCISQNDPCLKNTHLKLFVFLSLTSVSFQSFWLILLMYFCEQIFLFQYRPVHLFSSKHLNNEEIQFSDPHFKYSEIFELNLLSAVRGVLLSDPLTVKQKDICESTVTFANEKHQGWLIILSWFILLFLFNTVEYALKNVQLKSCPFKDVHPSYWLLLRILSSHWLRRVDIFKWTTF